MTSIHVLFDKLGTCVSYVKKISSQAQPLEEGSGLSLAILYTSVEESIAPKGLVTWGLIIMLSLHLKTEV